jgi:hypothetical protein
VDTKELTLEYKGKPEVFVIKKISFGDFTDIQDECIPNEMIGKVSKAHMSMGKFQRLCTLKGLEKAPFEINLETIRNIPATLGKALFDEINEFNSFNEEKKEN